MNKAKNVTWREYRKKLVRDPEVRKELIKIEPEYQLARSLIAARIKSKLTQAEIAKRAKTNQASISRLETGAAKPSISFLQRIASALGAKLMVRFEV